MKQTCSWVVVSILGLGGIAACGDGQAPSNYRGEPLTSLNGVVTSSQSTLSQDLVPAFVFVDGPLYKETLDTTTRFIQGEVDGTFPSSFTMRLYDPPPATTLETYIDGEPAFAQATIAAVRPDHPAWLENKAYAEPVEGGDIERDEVCSSTECISGHPSECPDGDQDPNWAWPCGYKYPEELGWDTYGYSAKHSILYFAGPVPAGSVFSRLVGDGSAVAAGYHLIERNEAAAEADRGCYSRAGERARIEWEKSHGPSEGGPNVVQFTSAAENREFSVLVSTFTAEERCTPPIRLVSEMSSTRVELQFIDRLTATAMFGR